MIYLALRLLEEGMIVAKDVDTHSVNHMGIPLVRKGVSLTTQMLRKLKIHGVSGIYVEQEGTEDIIAPDPIDNSLKNRTLKEIKTVFEEFNSSSGRTGAKAVAAIADISQSLIESVLSQPDMLVSLVELKSHDDYTYVHSLCVALLSVATGIAMGYPSSKLQELSTSALMHDIGKIRIPVAIINKPGRLSPAEFEIVKQHPVMGRAILEEKEHIVPYAVLAGVRSHHEKYDGTGYPMGREKNTIHPYARIIAIADVYDALTSDRPYRSAGSPCEAVEYIMAGVGSHFDYEMVNAFLKKIVAFPIGSKIRLSDGRFAVVVRNNPANVMRPMIKIFDENDALSGEADLFGDRRYHNVTILGMA